MNENSFYAMFRFHYANLSERHPRKAQVARYLIGGGTATVVDLGFLYLFTSAFRLWYLLSAVLAFLIAFVVSFLMQKYWTFADRNAAWKSQAALYFMVTGGNLILNTLLMYLFVDHLGVHYVLSQLIISALLACESYFLYQLIVFKPQRGMDA